MLKACLPLLLVIAFEASALSSKPVRQPHISVSLIAERNQAVPGEGFHAAIKLQPDEHWHVYWRNPGDSGMPVSVSWTLPEGVTAGGILWPRPHKIPFGSLTNYGYENSVVLPGLVSIPPDYKSSTLKLEAHASWLVCKDACIPGNAKLVLDIPMGEVSRPSSLASEIEASLSRVPKRLELMSASLTHKEKALSFELFARQAVFKHAKKIDFFPVNESLFDASAIPEVFYKNNVLRLNQSKSDSFFNIPRTIGGLLIIDDHDAWEFSFDSHDN